ncbi:glycoside hydrolase domain-containing protein [Gemmatimonadota bacterium]
MGIRFPRVLRTGALLVPLVAFTACTDSAPETAELYRAPTIPNEIDGVTFEAGNWEPHLAAGAAGVSRGNHRAVVVVEDEVWRQDPSPEAVLVSIPWRRRDTDPSSKAIIVTDATTGEPVRNALATRVENASGEVIFQPNPGSTVYHVYYMPWQSTGGYYPTITYPSADQLRDPSGAAGAERDSPSRADAAGRSRFSWEGVVSRNDPAWEAAIGSTPGGALPRARTTHIQSVNDFHSFFPMEVIATPEETAAFMASVPRGWAVVPEHRDYPVRMRRFIPHHWVNRGTPASPDDGAVFTSRALRDEAFTFQVALVAADESLTDVKVSFTGFPERWLEALTCFNCEGIDEEGVYFEKEISVPANTIQPLWIGIRIPADQPPGTVEGSVTVATADRGTQSVPVVLEVGDGRAIDGGSDEPELMTRLAWLNSTAGTDTDFIIEPFEPVAVSDRSLSILGRRVELGGSGLPEQIFSYFTPELTRLAEDPEPILARPLELRITAGGRTERFQTTPYRIQQESRGLARWTAENSSEHLTMRVEGRLEYDGMLDCRISLVARTDIAVDDIALPVALQPDAAEYMLGLGRKGGKRPTGIDWKWAIENHQEGVWLGGVHKGLQYVLRDENYVRPLNTNFYRNQPLHMPPSWFNEGRGGIRIYEEPGAVTAYNYSGPRTLAAGDTLHFNVRFLITPFKPINTVTHFNTRFVHKYVPVDSVRAWGGTVVNIHHANEINPYINYPFFNLDQQGAYIDEAHEKGIKVKLYDTIRELTYRAHELFALRSLGDEILNDGEGGGHSWMQEHLEDGYHSAWHAWRVDDAAMLDKGTSRWTNYYIEGLSWLAANQHIDGLYLDDIAFSRETVKRLVTVLHEHRDEVVIDLHSANQFNVRDGFINSAILYMEHFPFISRLWFGEYFEYGLDEDYWLTEVSGLPFGLMGEMLQDGGHPYRGMLYGMTARIYGNVDPRPVWRMMNDFGIADSRMLGYWLKDAPVTTDHPRVLATSYVRPGRVLIALASWSERDEVVELSLDLDALGLGEGVRVYAPGVEGLQEEREVDLKAVRVPAGMGVFVVVVGIPFVPGA